MPTDLKHDAGTAHCSQEIADWLDPNGALRRAGLMQVDIETDPAQVTIKEKEINP